MRMMAVAAAQEPLFFEVGKSTLCPHGVAPAKTTGDVKKPSADPDDSTDFAFESLEEDPFTWRQPL